MSKTTTKEEDKKYVKEELEKTILPEKVSEKQKKSENKNEDIIEMKRSDFEKIMKQLEKQNKDIDLLYKTADKNRMARELNKEGESLVKVTHVSTWGTTGKIIVGWSNLITNRTEVVQGRWIEDQTTNIVFEDGSVETVSYLEFVRNRLIKLEAEIIGKTKEIDEKGVEKVILKLQFPSGKVILLDQTFVN